MRLILTDYRNDDWVLLSNGDADEMNAIIDKEVEESKEQLIKMEIERIIADSVKNDEGYFTTS